VLFGVFGALPFWFSGQFGPYVDCFFETISGFTTTGATILTAIEGLPMGLLFWRSFTHWLGGMGVLVLTAALLARHHDTALLGLGTLAAQARASSQSSTSL